MIQWDSLKQEIPLLKLLFSSFNNGIQIVQRVNMNVYFFNSTSVIACLNASFGKAP